MLCGRRLQQEMKPNSPANQRLCRQLPPSLRRGRLRCLPLGAAATCALPPGTQPATGAEALHAPHRPALQVADLQCKTRNTRCISTGQFEPFQMKLLHPEFVSAHWVGPGSKNPALASLVSSCSCWSRRASWSFQRRCWHRRTHSLKQRSTSRRASTARACVHSTYSAQCVATPGESISLLGSIHGIMPL